MDGIFLWLVAGAGGLVFMAVVVAWWEHLGRSERPQPEFASTPPRAVSIDVELDKLDAPAADDTCQRREVLDNAMVRMAQPGVAVDARRNWADTTPMVGSSLLGELPAAGSQPTPPKPEASANPREFAPSEQP